MPATDLGQRWSDPCGDHVANMGDKRWASSNVFRRTMIWLSNLTTLPLTTIVQQALSWTPAGQNTRG